MNAQNLIRVAISSLIVVVAVLSALGLAWWTSPPEPLSTYTGGGQVILTIVLAASALGLWTLWRPARDAR